MAETTKGQRIGYSILLIALLGGTIGSFVLMTHQALNPDLDDLASRQELTDLQNELMDYQAKLTTWQNKLVDKYSPLYIDEFKQYEKANYAFNAESVSELTTKDLKEGDGAVLTEDSKYQAFYIGWLPDGEVFDSSFNGDKLKAPLEGGNLIEGWNEGVIGMKIGGVRELTIPAEKAYGESGSGSIPANSPIKFIVKIIPEMTAEEAAEKPVFQQ